MSDSWYKVDNVAKVFLATASMRDPRVFRISCTLQEQVDPDTLNEALRRTAQEAENGLCGVIDRTEPILIGFLTASVGLTLLSVMLPLLGILSAV